MQPNTHMDLTTVGRQLLDEAYRLLAALPLLALALLVIWLAWMVGGWLSRRALLDRFASRNPFMRDLARTTARWLVVLVGIVIALQLLDATALVGAVLGTAGVLGVALGFAFKDILENYLAGILMSVRQPFAPRDHVVIDGNEGVVVSLNSRATVLMTLDGNHLRLPNALVFRSVTLNYTRNPSRRFDFDIGIGVNEDLLRAQQLGIDELARIDGVISDPPPRALVTALGDSNVQMQYRGWVDQREHDFVTVKSEAIRLVKMVLEDADMDMPEPIYRVQLTEHHPVAAATEPKTRTHTGVVAAPDTSARKEIENQIDREKQQQPAQDLLNPASPRE